MKGLKHKLQEIDFKVHELSEKVSLLKSFETLGPADLSQVESIAEHLNQLSRKAITSWKNWHEVEHLEISKLDSFVEAIKKDSLHFEEILGLSIGIENTSTHRGHLYLDLNEFKEVFRKTLRNSKSSNAKKIHIRIEDINDFVSLSINDDGMGIDRAKLDELNSESSRMEGQGQYIKNKVFSMGAQVYWNSIEGIGSSCVLQFQICSVDEAKEVANKKHVMGIQAELEHTKGIAGSTIMIVDDSRVTLKLFEDLFTEHGAKVELFSKPEQALECLSELKPNCLIVDFEMPVMNGIEFIEKVRQHKVYSDLPILMLTSREDDDTIVRCIKAGANDYIFKTTNVDVILSKLDSTLQQVKIRKELLSLKQVAAVKSVIVTLNHEFNNIVTILMGRLTGFKRVLSDADKEQVVPLEKNLLRLVKLIKKISEIEKYGHTEYTDGTEMIDLAESVDKKVG